MSTEIDLRNAYRASELSVTDGLQPIVDDAEIIKHLKSRSHSYARSQIHWVKRWNTFWNDWKVHPENAWLELQNAPAIPVNNIAFESFLIELSETLASGSVMQAVHAINSFSINMNFPAVTSKSVKNFFRELVIEEANNDITTGQAIPVTMPELKKLIRLHRNTDSLQDLRNLLMIWIGFETLLRSTELRRIKLEDLTFNPVEERYVLTVKRTKTQLKTKIAYWLSPHCTQTINRLLEKVGMDPKTHPAEYLFQPIDQRGENYLSSTHERRSKGKSLKTLLEQSDLPTEALVTSKGKPLKVEDVGTISANTLLRAFASMYESLGYKLKLSSDGRRYTCWTGHSVRVGGAIELALSGYSVTQIMENGNWGSPAMVAGYIRNVSAKDKAMVSFMNDELADLDL
ncbi:UNVERIFIED_ORG: integrase [Rahnella aquatilis]